MNERYVIDAYAWVEYLIGSKAGEKVKLVLENENNEHQTLAKNLHSFIQIRVTRGEKRSVNLKIRVERRSGKIAYF